jgi:hypothetical protein
MTRMLHALLATLLLVAMGCGGESGGDPDGGSQPGDPDAGEISGEWRTLIESSWELGPGTEDYWCERLTVEEDMYIVSFRAIAPLGTHHTVLTVGNPTREDGGYRCDAGTNANAMIYGSGVGTNPLAFPEGVAMRVSAGQQLVLNLHLFNTSDATITGTSGTEVILVPAVPPGESTQSGRCTMNGNVTVFSVAPHMHQLGTHMRVVARPSSGDVTLLDEPYDFYEQSTYPIDPIALSQGDRIEVHCTYDNDTGSSVGFGDSSDEEMCFAGVYRYPAHGALIGGFICDDGPF